MEHRRRSARKREAPRPPGANAGQDDRDRTPPSRSGSRRFGLRGRLLVAATSVLVGLSLAEVLIRATGFASAIKPIVLSDVESVYQRSDNPILGYELKPNHRDEQADSIRSYAFTNAHGLRDFERDLDKPSGAARILLLGDSVVEGLGIRDLRDTMSAQLEGFLASPRVQVLNFGVSGYCTRAEVELLERKGLGFNPDVVVLVFVENDFENFNRGAARLAGFTDRPAIVKALYLRSHLARLTMIRFDLFAFGADADPGVWNQQAIGDNNVVDGFRRLRALAGQHGFGVLIAIWPQFTNSNVVDLHAMPDDPSSLIVERLARQFGLPTVRLSARFKRWLGEGGERNPRLRFTIGDGLHPSVEGCRVTADAIRDALESFGLTAGGVSRGGDLPAAGPADPEALAVAQQRGSSKPDYAFRHADLGYALQQRGRLDEAVAEYGRALEFKPTYALVHYNLAQALEQQGQREQAFEHYRQTIALNPDYAEAYAGLAGLFRADGRLDEALSHDRLAVRANPRLAEAWYGQGNTLRLRGDSEGAADSYRRALALRPEYAEAHNNLAIAFQSTGDLEAALDHYRKALNVAPDMIEAHNNAGLILAARGELPGAIEHYRKALGVAPDTPELRDNLGRALLARSDTDEAIVELKEAVRLRPEWVEAHFDLGLAYEHDGQRDAAVGEYRRVLELSPDHQAARRRLESLAP